MTNLVLTVVGDDRPGLVNALAAKVAEHEGNWLNSDMARLGGKFAGIVLVDVPEAKVDGLAAQLERLGVLEVKVTHTEDQKPAGAQWTLALVGNDRPGIVREISAALVAAGVSFLDLETTTRDAPMSGGRLFEAKALLTAPDGADRAEVASRLEDIAQELMVDIDLSGADE
ncbi:glycine cleavage system regulatory protein [Mariniluteicoccus endophyticus]